MVTLSRTFLCATYEKPLFEDVVEPSPFSDYEDCLVDQYFNRKFLPFLNEQVIAIDTSFQSIVPCVSKPPFTAQPFSYLLEDCSYEFGKIIGQPYFAYSNCRLSYLYRTNTDAVKMSDPLDASRLKLSDFRFRLASDDERGEIERAIEAGNAVWSS